MLHKHPYCETWIVRSGRARMTADGQDIEPGPGDIVVVGSETPQFKTSQRAARHHRHPLVTANDPGVVGRVMGRSISSAAARS
jgi:Cupin domain